MFPEQGRLGYGNYVVIKNEDKVKLGIHGIYDRKGLNGIGIDFAFLYEHKGHGCDYEAVSKIKNLAFHEFEF